MVRIACRTSKSYISNPSNNSSCRGRKGTISERKNSVVHTASRTSNSYTPNYYNNDYFRGRTDTNS